MDLIYHLVPAEEWERFEGALLYTAPSLSGQGFLHAAGSVEQALRVANRRFRGQGKLLALCIDKSRVRPEVRYEEAGDPEPFPHILGPLNTDAIVEVRELRRDSSGPFVGL